MALRWQLRVVYSIEAYPPYRTVHRISAHHVFTM